METIDICACGHAAVLHGPQSCLGGRFRPCACATRGRAAAPPPDGIDVRTIYPADWAFRHGGDASIRIR